MALIDINTIALFDLVTNLHIKSSFYWVKVGFLEIKFFWIFEERSENSPYSA